MVRARTPHGQILRYLSTVEAAPDGGARWGILTNGGTWRLYDRRARPRATGYFEVDLADVLQRDAEDELRTFNLLFRRDSFVRRAGATETFLERALEEGRRYERRVAQDLSRVVFERAFPSLAQALADAGGTRPRTGPPGGAGAPLPAAVRALRRGPGSPARKRHPLRRLRAAQRVRDDIADRIRSKATRFRPSPPATTTTS